MGNKNQTILTLNGRQYDAVTGKPLVGSGARGAAHPINDVVKVAKHSTPTVALAEHKVAKQPPVPVASPKKAMDIQRAPHHVQHHQTQRATTLMRSAVHKPLPGLKRQVKAITRTDILAKSPVVAITEKWSFNQIDPQRLSRARRVAKSQLIRKFSRTTFVASPEPTGLSGIWHSQAPQQAAVSSAQPVHTKQSMDVFEKALAHANAHEQTYVSPKQAAKAAKKHAKHTAKTTRKKPAHHHLASVAAASLTVLLLAGFIGYQNKADITLRFASAKAGFHATLPNNKPAGFALSKFSYGVGNVDVSFHNGASGRNFDITQQSTMWDNQSLLDNYVAANYPSYQALQSTDRIIYIYGNNNASWVNNGIWYQLNTNGALSTSDILSVASSM